MAMPPQLRNCIRPRKSTKPIVEQLPSISISELRVPRDFKTYTLPNVSLRYPYLSGVRLSCAAVEFHIPSPFRGREGTVQTFRLKHIKTGFGIRHAFICNTCNRAVLKLYYLNRSLACRRCSNARYASQVCDKHSRPVLQAARVQSFLDNKPRLFRSARERLEKKFGQKVMLAQGRMGTKAHRLLD
jgi:hypothetical protein